jgi:mandelate racemase/muconate lactonizing enzyme family protein
MLKAEYCRYNLIFKQPAVTSRAVMRDKLTYFIRVFDDRCPEKFGLGECALFEGLSCDDVPDYEDLLAKVCRCINEVNPSQMAEYPSIRFGLETALCDLANGGVRKPFLSAWTDGRGKIPINGLVWMGTAEEMSRRVDEKIAAGFRCIKLKIGGVKFEDELDIIRRIRSEHSPEELEIRLDANGAFTTDNALDRLEALSVFTIHSLEQPIKASQWEAMAEICRKSPVPIALDEELIGLNNQDIRREMLSKVRPQYIILKPALIGGLHVAEQWIDLASEFGAGWWATSALESNVGLNAIAQWVTARGFDMPQGLGTGALYVNNIPSPICQIGDGLIYDPDGRWDLSDLKWNL